MDLAARRLIAEGRGLAHPEVLVDLVERFGNLSNHILIASDYPHWDGDNPDVVLPSGLDDKLVRGIQCENARALYGL